MHIYIYIYIYMYIYIYIYLYIFRRGLESESSEQTIPSRSRCLARIISPSPQIQTLCTLSILSPALSLSRHSSSQPWLRRARFMSVSLG